VVAGLCDRLGVIETVDATASAAEKASATYRTGVATLAKCRNEGEGVRGPSLAVLG
jgi:hypothetical protein